MGLLHSAASFSTVMLFQAEEGRLQRHARARATPRGREILAVASVCVVLTMVGAARSIFQGG
jgi:hypothetical protein